MYGALMPGHNENTLLWLFFSFFSFPYFFHILFSTSLSDCGKFTICRSPAMAGHTFWRRQGEEGEKEGASFDRTLKCCFFSPSLFSLICVAVFAFGEGWQHCGFWMWVFSDTG